MCEGTDDNITLNTLLQGNEIDIIHCDGATNIHKFLNLPYNTQNGATLLCLFDNDKEGREGESKVNKDLKTYKNTIKTLFVSDVEGHKMEDILGNETLKQNLTDNIKKEFGLLQS